LSQSFWHRGVKGLRKIVERSKAKAGGARVRGPTICFFQTTKGAPVKFKTEWIEEFIDKHTVDPEKGAPSSNGRKKKKRRPGIEISQRDRELLKV